MMIYVVFIMTILLLYRIEQVARYIDLGAAEDADVDDEAGATRVPTTENQMVVLLSGH